MGVWPSLEHSQPAQSPPPLPHLMNPVVLLSDKSVLVPPSTGFPQRPEHRLVQPSRPSRTWPWWLLPPSSHCLLPLQQDKNVSASRLCTSCSLCLELSDCHLATSFSSARTPLRGHSSEGPSLATLPKTIPDTPHCMAQQHLMVPALLSSLWICCLCPNGLAGPGGKGQSRVPRPRTCWVLCLQQESYTSETELSSPPAQEGPGLHQPGSHQERPRRVLGQEDSGWAGEATWSRGQKRLMSRSPLWCRRCPHLPGPLPLPYALALGTPASQPGVSFAHRSPDLILEDMGFWFCVQVLRALAHSLGLPGSVLCPPTPRSNTSPPGLPSPGSSSERRPRLAGASTQALSTQEPPHPKPSEGAPKQVQLRDTQPHPPLS